VITSNLGNFIDDRFGASNGRDAIVLRTPMVSSNVFDSNGFGSNGFESDSEASREG
jgi:hypothetical protein